MPKTALITGITGQDGSHLADLLLEKGYDVWGMVRRTSSPKFENVAHLQDDIQFVSGDLGDSESLGAVVRESEPDEVYNLAAQSHVHTSWKQPTFTADISGLGAMRLLDAVRGNAPGAKFYQASSSEMFGSSPAPQNEETRFRPRSPYAIAKVFAHHTTINYRESYGMFAVSGILFNHEGPRRGPEFVTRKISYGVARIAAVGKGQIHLGNMDASRDWGYAPEYVDAMWRMLQTKKPTDYVIGTGKTHTVREFLEEALKVAGLTSGLKKYVKTDPRFIRPAEVDELHADARKARRELRWKPDTTFRQLVRLMVESDIKRLHEDPKYVPSTVA